MDKAICSLLALFMISSCSAAHKADTHHSPIAADPWYEGGQAALRKRLSVKPDTSRARNVILFVGDGMGVSTITAARIYDGQSRGERGEENVLSFERLPHAALIKTYNTNQQVPDSAGTATAMHSGVKTRAGVIGIGSEPHRADCKASLAHHRSNLGELRRPPANGRGL